MFLLIYGGGVSTGFVGAAGFYVLVVYGCFYSVVVVVVGNTWVYYVVYLGIVVGCDMFCNCCCCLFLMFYRILICLRIVFCIYFSVLLMLSGGVYLDSNAYFF
jgi:hypothetical protein